MESCLKQTDTYLISTMWEKKEIFRIHLKCTLQAKSIFSELLNARSQPCTVSVLYCTTSLFSNWMINCKNHKHRFLHQCPSICSGSMAPYTSTVLVISLRHLSDTLWPLTKRSHDVGIFCCSFAPTLRELQRQNICFHFNQADSRINKNESFLCPFSASF